jgi:hypothetical protein
VVGTVSIWPNEILTPEHTLRSPLTGKAVQSTAEWLALQRWVLDNNRRMLPKLNWPEPWLSLDVPVVYVNCGRWMIRCACGDCPLVHPGWDLSLCLGCGAIYERVKMPEDAEEIAKVLCMRAEVYQRNWAPPETVADLSAENLAHGDAA